MSDQLLSGNISFAGLGSGTDFSALIDGLMKIEQRRVTKLEDWRKSWDDKIVQFRDLNTKLLSLKTSLEGMNTLGKFLVKDAVSSNEASFTATAGAESSEGTYNIKVGSLAKNSIWTSNALGSATTDIVNDTNADLKGSLAFTIDGKTITTSISEGQNLNDLAAAINANTDNRYTDTDGVSKQYVRASVVKTQSSPDQYVLQLSALDQGTKYAISGITPTDLDLTFPGAATQVATNAQIEFNGLTITRSSNVIDDIVPGITLNLKQVDTVGATLTVNTDKEAIKENVRAFVDAVNEVRKKISEISKVDATTNQGSILTGNYGVDMIGQNLKNIIASKGIGFDYDSNTYSALPQIGIMTNADEGSIESGLLTLDESKLDEALAKDPEILASLFSAYYQGSSDSPNFSYASSLPGTTKAGTYEVAYTVSGGSASGTIGGHAATWDGTTKQLTGAAGTPVAGLVVSVTNLTDGAYTGNVSLLLGKTNELIDELKVLTDPKSGPSDFEAGPLAVLEENYRDIIASIDKKIEYEEKRITRLTRQYKDRFARLDAMLSYYNSVSAGMQSQIIGMMKE